MATASRCERCGGNIYWDNYDRSYYCLACARRCRADGKNILPRYIRFNNKPLVFRSASDYIMWLIRLR